MLHCVQGIQSSQTLISEPHRPHDTTPLWREILEMRTMWMQQPGLPKDSSPTSHKYIYWILHIAFNFRRRKWQLLGDWMRQDWLGLCLRLWNHTGSIPFYSCILLLGLRQVRVAGKKNLAATTDLPSLTDLEPGVHGLSHLQQCHWLLALGWRGTPGDPSQAN